MISRQRYKAILGACSLGLVVALLGAATESALATSSANSAVKATTISVIAGKPSELAFKVTMFSNLTAGTFTFRVKNEGLAFHDFKICTSPVKNAAHNSCVGVQTKLLHPGQTATLTVKLTKKGLYEYVCSVPGHASAGMKGLIGVGVVYKPKTVVTVPTPTTTAAATTTTQPTTTAATTTTTAGGGDVSQDPNCPAGQTIKVATGGNGDGDGDEQGFASDGDGCV